MNFSPRGHYVSLLILAITMNLTAACSGTFYRAVTNAPDPLAGTIKNTAYHGQSFQKLMVIELTEQGSHRVAVENAFADQLITAGVDISVGSIYLPDADSRREKAVVEEALRKGNFDGVLTVEIINMKEGEDSKKAPAVWKEKGIADRSDMFGKLAATEGAGRKFSQNLRMEMALWDVKTARLVWAGTTSAIDKYDIVSEAYPAARSTAAELIKAKLVRLKQ